MGDQPEYVPGLMMALSASSPARSRARTGALTLWRLRSLSATNIVGGIARLEGVRHEASRPTLSRSRHSVSDLRAECLQDLGGVAVGLDVVPGPLDPALLVDQEGGAQYADGGLAVADFLTPGAPSIDDLVVGVGQQREAQPVLVAEALVALGVVGRDADHRDAGGLEGGQVVVELAGFSSAAGGIVGGVEVDEHLAALEILQRHRGAVLVGKGERGRLGAGLKLGHSDPLNQGIGT